MSPRCSTCAVVNVARFGAAADSAHTIADPTTPIRIDRRRPRRSAIAIANSAKSAPSRVRANATPIVASDAPKEWLIGRAELTEERGRERDDRSRGRRGCDEDGLVGAECDWGETHDPLRRPWPRPVLERGPQGLERVGPGPTVRDGHERPEEPPEERDVDRAARLDQHVGTARGGRDHDPERDGRLPVAGSVDLERSRRSRRHGMEVLDRGVPDEVGPPRAERAKTAARAACYGRTPSVSRRVHMTKLAVGDKAPAFTLKDQNGKTREALRREGQARRRVLLSEGRHARLHHSSRATCATRSRS